MEIFLEEALIIPILRTGRAWMELEGRMVPRTDPLPHSSHPTRPMQYPLPRPCLHLLLPSGPRNTQS